MIKKKILASVLTLSLVIGILPSFSTADVYAKKYGGFKYTQDFSDDVSNWDEDGTGKWITSYKKGKDVLSNWSRDVDETGNGRLALSSNSRPVFWFDAPITDGNIHLSFDVYYTASSSNYSYFWAGFQSVDGTDTKDGIEIDAPIDNTGLLNGFGINTYANKILHSMTTSGGGQVTRSCEEKKWYKLDVVHENLGGRLVSRYYIDGTLIKTKADQTFTGSLYGVTLYSNGNNKDNVIYIDNLSVEHYYENEKEAKVVFSEVVEKSNVESVTLGTNKTPSSAVYGGDSCWLMDSENSDINIIFSDEFRSHFKDGSFYTVEVDYYDIKILDDSGDTVPGYFRLYYDSFDNSKKTGGTVYTKGTEGWKTASFDLEDADFEKTLGNKYDLQLSLKALTTNGMKASPSNVAVKEIRVKRDIAKNPVFVTSTTEQTGHTFSWFEDNKIITNTITNFSDVTQNICITSKLLDENGREVFKKLEELTLSAREEATTTVDIGSVKRCDIYDWVVDVEYSNGLSSNFSPIKIAIVKTDPDGILNDDVYIILDPNDNEDIMKHGVSMLKHSNIGGIRSSVYWSTLETEKGVYNWENHQRKPFFDEVSKNGLEILPLLFGGSSHYGLELTDMPYSDDELEGWKNYVHNIVSTLSENYGVKRYEVWNEPDIKNFNSRYFDDIPDNGGTGADYANLFNATKEVIKDIDPTIKVGGPTLSRITYRSEVSGQRIGHEYFADVLDGGFADYADAISFHPYGHLGAPIDTSDSMVEGIKGYKEEFSKKNGEVVPEVWVTETGYTTADELIDSAYKQGALNCRTAIFSKANGLSDLTIFYDLAKRGTVETSRSDMYGHVSAGKEGGEKYGTYFVPEKSYLMITAMNYVMAKTKAKSMHDSEDGNVKISRFTSEKFGKDVLTFYNTTGDKGIRLDLGVNEITYLDCMGNETVMTSDNGIYTFAAEIAPQYIIGDFKNVEYIERSEAYVIKDIDLTVPGKVTVTVFAENENQRPCMIIAESHKDNHIEQIVFKQETLKSGLGTYMLNLNFEDADDVSVFLWGADIRPISRSFTKKVNVSDRR